MTRNVFGGTLTLTQSINQSLQSERVRITQSLISYGTKTA